MVLCHDNMDRAAKRRRGAPAAGETTKEPRNPMRWWMNAYMRHLELRKYQQAMEAEYCRAHGLVKVAGEFVCVWCKTPCQASVMTHCEARRTHRA